MSQEHTDAVVGDEVGPLGFLESRACAPLLVLLIILVFYGIHLVRIPVGTDNSLIYAPFFSMRWDGGPPWWNPYSAGGGGMLDNFQAAMLYPLRWPFFFLSDWTSYYGIFGFLHYAVAAGGMLLWLRSLGFQTVAAVAGTVAFACGGYMAGRIINPTIFYASCWMPLILYAASGNDLRHHWALTAAFYMILSIGSPHLILYGPLAHLIVYTCRLPEGFSVRDVLMRGLHAGLALLMAAPAFLGGILRVPRTLRSEATVDGNLSDSVAFAEIPRMFLGGTGGSSYPEYVDKAFYLGPAVLVVILAAAFSRELWRDWRWRSGIALMAVGFLFALGNNVGLQFAMPYIPGFSKLAGPARALVMAAGGVGLLLACAMERWDRLDSRVLWSLAAAGFLLAVGTLLFRVHQGDGPGVGDWLRAWLLDSRAVYREFHPPVDSVVFLAMMLGLLAIRAKLGARAPALFLLMLVMLPLWHFRGRVFLEMRPRSSFDPPATVEAIRADRAGGPAEPFRIASFDPIRVHARDFTEAHVSDFLEPNLSTLYGLESIEGFDPLIDLRYRDLVEGHAGRASYDDPIRTLHLERPSEDLFRLLNVQYLIGHPNDRALKGAGFQLHPNGHGQAAIEFSDEQRLYGIDHWQFVSLVDANRGDINPLKPVAEMIVTGAHGEWRFPIRIGVETDSLYMLDPEVPVSAQPSPVPVHARWFLHSPLAGTSALRLSVSNYRGRVRFPEATQITRVEWRLLQPAVLVVASQGYRIAEDSDFSTRWSIVYTDPDGVTPVYRFLDARARASLLPMPERREENAVSLSAEDISANSLPNARASFLEYRNSSMMLKVDTPTTAMLLLRQPFAYMTDVRVDGRNVQPLSVNTGLFAGIPLTEAGVYRVEIRHRPPLWLLGLGVLGLLITASLGGWDLTRKKNQR